MTREERLEAINQELRYWGGKWRRTHNMKAFIDATPEERKEKLYRYIQEDLMKEARKLGGW